MLQSGQTVEVTALHGIVREGEAAVTWFLQTAEGGRLLGLDAVEREATMEEFETTVSGPVVYRVVFPAHGNSIKAEVEALPCRFTAKMVVFPAEPKDLYTSRIRLEQLHYYLLATTVKQAEELALVQAQERVGLARRSLEVAESRLAAIEVRAFMERAGSLLSEDAGDE